MNRTDGADLCGIAVNWHLEAHLEALVRAWPKDPRYELIVVDNSATFATDDKDVRVLTPERNLGFGGAINLGCTATTASVVVTLNPDASPNAAAIEALLAGFDRWPDAVGLAPRLVGSDGQSQARWQLKALPSPWTLLLQSLLIPAGRGASVEPQAGALVEQPAAAVLALRRDVLLEIGGFDEDFFPAWFEDVDLAARMKARGARIRYAPDSVFTHVLGASVGRLGYRSFLSIYYRNLCLYLRKHHGARWALASRVLLATTAPLRIVALPLRRPRRAPTRRDAALGLLQLTRDALSNWRGSSHPCLESDIDKSIGSGGQNA